MDPVPDKVSFPDKEDETLEFWDKIDAFKTSVKKSEGRPVYTFYDGPPFATGMPHYGHLLAGTIKDTVTRYAHQTGHYVERRWGWDCHGLPVEMVVEEKLGIKGREDILKMGIDKYNAECRGVVMTYANDWKRVIRRMARWIDMENDYKTLNLSFMESVWWVFRQLFDKGLVYRGFKVMPYSTACGTCLSNFEANLNYKDTSDPSVFVTLPLVAEPDVSFIAWTTTPWTLPSNVALCVNPTMEYCRYTEKASGKKYIVAVDRIKTMYKKAEEYTIDSTFAGETLRNTRYVPLFDYFVEPVEREDGYFRVLVDSYVTSDSGTGVVHQAPAFGEDDARVCIANGVISKGAQPPCPVDANGKFTAEVTHFAGQYIKDADKGIQRDLKDRGRMFKSGSIVHSYPFCWRTETPLIYRTVPSWFIAVEKIKDRVQERNKETAWVPTFVQEKRFANWLEDARDWAVSRDRFWGTPLPLWHSEDWEELVCVGSVEELKELTGIEVTDLHRESVDHITIPSKMGKEPLKRVEQVFDCWFESGSMPYAQQHYPFENKDKFEGGFPADFIAEGLDQTRGWFYTLMVLSTALFDKPPFKNLICNGLVLASDGKKMSKRLKNYPDPELVLKKHGADALRLYMLNSPAVRAETLKFQESGVEQVVRGVFLPWYNAYRFLEQAISRFEASSGTKFAPVGKDHVVESKNVMDQWIQAACAGMLTFIREEMAGYRLYTVGPRLVEFIENLTNWYVRMNRSRLKGDGNGAEDTVVALSTLFEVLMMLSKACGPFTPLFAELLYQNLSKLVPGSEESVHYCMFPEPAAGAVDPRMEEKVRRMQALIDKGRLVRDKINVSLKMPLPSLTVFHSDPEFLADIADMTPYIESELNTRAIKLDSETVVKVTVTVNLSSCGKRLARDVKKVKEAVKGFTQEQVQAYMKEGTITVEGHQLVTGDLAVARELSGGAPEDCVVESYEDVLVVFETKVTPELMAEGHARDVIGRVQKLRKASGLQVADKVTVYYKASGDLNTIVKDKVSQTLLVKPLEEMEAGAEEVAREESKVLEDDLTIVLCRLKDLDIKL